MSDSETKTDPITAWRELSPDDRDGVYALLRAAGSAAYGRGHREAGRAVAIACAILYRMDPETDET